MKIPIKPLSINQAYNGRRTRSKKYNKYIRDVFIFLRKADIPTGLLHLDIVFGFSSMGSDFDNCVKPFVDCLQKYYGFNDNRIRGASIDCKSVDKGHEYIEFEIKEYVTNT